jgi:hypothetical protein
MLSPSQTAQLPPDAASIEAGSQQRDAGSASTLPDQPVATAAPGAGAQEEEGEEGLSEIAQAMRALEEAACPRKRTMTRFSFLGGTFCLLFVCFSM